MKYDAREELLRRVTIGELNADSPEVLAAASEDDAFARELDATLEAIAALERGAAEQTAVLAEVAEGRGAPGSDRVRELVLARVERAASGGRSPLRVWLAVAAALVALTLGVWRPWHEREPDRDQPLGGDDAIELLEPLGRRKSYAEFRWRGPIEGGYYEVFVREPNGGPVIERSVQVAADGDLLWEPDDTSEWPEEIEWYVRWTTFDTPQVTSSPPGSASR